MDRRAIIDAILELARSRSADELAEGTISLTEGQLYTEALHQFGGWDLALAHALSRATADRGERPVREAPAGGAPARARVVERSVHPDALRPLYALTTTGFLARVPAALVVPAEAPATPRHAKEWPEELGRIAALADLGSARAVLTVSDDGRLFGWDARLVPDARLGEMPRRLGSESGVSRWVAALDRREPTRRELVVSASRLGKVKASLATDLPRPVPHDGVVGFLVDEGDDPVDYLAMDEGSTLVLVSSSGHAIRFPVEDVRPMGLRAVGVKGIDLRGPAEVVAALVAPSDDALDSGDGVALADDTDRKDAAGHQGDQIVLLSRRGYGKRVPVAEFRSQGRGGLGLVAAKLARDDALAAAAITVFNADIAVITDGGRLARLPVDAFPEMGRPARGDRVVVPPDGESVVAIARLLPGPRAAGP